ncbi:MAG TPA: VOC family protein [Streptosporangiaceae bacterium]|jgi:predicted enzyme related to lactoylglutathione lyase
MPADDSVLVAGRPGQPGLLFLRVPERKTAKNRVHFDLWPTATVRDAEVDRALRLGATVLADRRQPGGSGWVVLADPEGNEFCVGSSAAEREARRPAPPR